jgi:hypothetical protein
MTDDCGTEAARIAKQEHYAQRKSSHEPLSLSAIFRAPPGRSAHGMTAQSFGIITPFGFIPVDSQK